MNGEKFEAIMLNASIKLALSSLGYNEVVRKFSIDNSDNLVCSVVGQNIDKEQKNFIFYTNEQGSWEGEMTNG